MCLVIFVETSGKKCMPGKTKCLPFFKKGFSSGGGGEGPEGALELDGKG